MPLQIIRHDITKLTCDAIVNAANSSLLGGGGVDGAIHKAAGDGLLLECKKLGGCETGQAKITGGYNLPCKYVIHTVGPRWQGGGAGEKELLESCYRASLGLAKAHACESVAFPLISSGIYGYPKAQALKVAVDVIGSFLLENDMLVYLVIFDKAAFQISEKLFADIRSYIDDCYAERHADSRLRIQERLKDQYLSREKSLLRGIAATSEAAYAFSDSVSDKTRLEEALKQIDESFSQMLLRKIDEKGMTDSQCYKKANVDRKLFSKIRSDSGYHPSKTTAIAFAIALELSLEETRELLMKAGFALSHSNEFDIIIEYFIVNGIYDIFAINNALFAFDQSTLGV